MKYETKRLYFDNPYQVEFKARVIGREVHGKTPALILDQTCFYPESGGQPADKGRINGVDVLDVLEKDTHILHVMQSEVEADEVSGIIEWETRFDHMQQHSGQHILSQCFDTLFDAKTLSFHLGTKTSTVEIDLRDITEDEVEKVEILANEIVFQDEEICTYITPEDMIDEVPLRKPPQKTGHIRVVQISDFDYSACGGTHPNKTGEIGLIKILKWERIRNNLRFEFVCGRRVLVDYGIKNRIIREVAVRFNVGESELIGSIDKMISELKDQRRQLKKTQEKCLEIEAREIRRTAASKVIKKIFSRRSPDEMRFLALSIIRSGTYVVLFGTDLEDRVHLVLACSESLGQDMRDLLPVISPLIDGKGGGRPSLVEIAGQKKEKLTLALDKASDFLGM
ncbi:MAG: alanine--tRNA ligase-related protein [Candidatus Aminicenantes bacterium]|jgi:alanyl-tRNA synthetase